MAKLGALSIEQRKTVLQILERSRRGHIGSAFSILEITRVLYDEILTFNAEQPMWDGRDRFILSKGHGCLALYVQLVRHKFFAEEHLWNVSNAGAILGGHPEYGLAPGIEASTGSLGHGLSIAVGAAMAARMDGKAFHTYALVGDGECNEGSIWEAAMSAAHHKLSNLSVIVDYNKFQCNAASATVLNLEPLADKWRSFGFAVEEVDGHDVAALKKLFQLLPFDSDRPSCVICHTQKGKGIPDLEGNAMWHHKSRLPDGEMEMLIAKLEAANA